MAKKAGDIAVINMAQDFQIVHWTDPLSPPPSDYADLVAALDAARDADSPDLNPLGNLIMARLTAAGIGVVEYYGIIHNQDVTSKWDFNKGCEVTDFAQYHGHHLIRLSGRVPLEKAAKAIGVQPQFLHRLPRGNNAYDGAQCYLTHVADKDKHQYDVSEVYTFAGPDYKSVAEKRWADWLKNRGKVEKKKALLDVDYVVERILEGEVTKQDLLTDAQLRNVYARNRGRCNDALLVYAEMVAEKNKQEFMAGGYYKTTFFFHGASGSGKSDGAKAMIRKLQSWSAEAFGRPWRYYRGSSKHPFDTYANEEIVWLDDARVNTMDPDEWLTLLDPYNINVANARFADKLITARVFIITSIKSPSRGV